MEKFHFAPLRKENLFAFARGSEKSKVRRMAGFSFQRILSFAFHFMFAQSMAKKIPQGSWLATTNSFS